MQKGYGQYCPIAKGAEIFAERWTPLIVRNIHVGAHTFTEIAAGCPRMTARILTRRAQMPWQSWHLNAFRAKQASPRGLR